MTPGGRSSSLSSPDPSEPSTDPNRHPNAPTRPTDGRADDVAELRREVAALRAQLAATAGYIEELRARTHEDDLTGILNRRGLYAEIARVAAFTERYDQPSALLYIDLDRFKAINDRHGHAVGDAVLVAVARRIADHLRRSDVFGRIGGDEFVIVLRQVDAVQAAAKAATIQHILGAGPIEVDGIGLRVGGSIGVAEFEAGDTPDQVITRADRAMYVDKRARKAAARLAGPADDPA